MSTGLDLSDFHESTLLEVLTRSFLPSRPPIDIPPYQRPYRWSISEVRKLLDDLDSFRYNPETGKYDEGAKYYYGTICFQVYYDRETQQVSKLELIDGQQRLTSFLILIKALLDTTERIKTEKIVNARNGLIKLLHNRPEPDQDAAGDDKDWDAEQWQPQYEYRQPQTQEHIATIYREQMAEYLRVKELSEQVAMPTRAEDDQGGNGKPEDVPTYVIEFFEGEFKRLSYALTNGALAVRIIKNRYDAELFFQCENNRGKDMQLVDMLKAYHLRIAHAVEKVDLTDEKGDPFRKIKGIWQTLTATEERYERFRTTVIGLLLIRLGVAYWEHWDKSNVEKLKGIHGTYKGNLVVDEKLKLTGVGHESAGGSFLPDLMTPVTPGLPFFRTLAYYQRIVEALYSSSWFGNRAESGSSEESKEPFRNMFRDMVLNKNWYFDDSNAIAVQAAVCWLDRFASVRPNLEAPFEEDVNGLIESYNKDMDFLVYVQSYIRLFKRLRVRLTVKRDNVKKDILVFGMLKGSRQVAFFKLGSPMENLITIPYRTNSPAECRRELERLTSPDMVSWAMVGDRQQTYRDYVEAESFVIVQDNQEQSK